jgi:uncharacterized DUF497 family protein
MEIAFDTTKDAANLEKNGISLAAAATLEWDDALTWTDDRKNYGEARMCAIAYIGNRLHYVAYVDRAEARRIISLRKANSREENDMPKLKPEAVSATPEEDAAISKAAMEDPDARPYTDAEWAAVKPVRGRGRPAGSGTKVATSLRLDRDLLQAFKDTGDGWQTRLNDALREWAKDHRMVTG